MIPREINYLLSHPAHAPLLVCSVDTLRRQSPDIPIKLHAWPYDALSRRERAHTDIASIDVCNEIAKAYNDIEVIEARPGQNARKRHLIHKIELMSERGGMLLDADTLIGLPIEGFFDLADGWEYTTTQFCDWRTTKPIMRTRIKRLLDIDGIEHGYVHRCLAEPWPSPNVGVFASEPGTPILPEWRDWSIKAAGVFIADETTMQALQVKYYDRVKIILGGKYNCSTMRYQPKSLDDTEVCVWHGHGASFLRPDKAFKGHCMWFHIFKQFLEQNKCKTAEWAPKVNNYRMPRFLDPTYVPNEKPEIPSHPFENYEVEN